MSPGRKPHSAPVADVPVARIAGLFGIAGELKCDPTSAGRPILSQGVQLRCVRDGESTMVRLASVRPHQGRLLIRIAGVEDAQAAESYVAAMLFAARSAISLREGEYLDEDLVGCSVRDTGGRQCGVVERVEHYPSSDMLIVGGRMLPMVRSIVVDIDLQHRCVTIDPPEGLLD